MQLYSSVARAKSPDFDCVAVLSHAAAAVQSAISICFFSWHCIDPGAAAVAVLH